MNDLNKSKGENFIMKVSFQNESDYLNVKVWGDWTIKDVISIVEKIYQEAQKRTYSRILLYANDLSLPKTDMVRFFSGDQIAKVWGHELKAAIVSKPEIIKDRKTETVARNRGVDLSVFICEVEALKWLLKN